MIQPFLHEQSYYAVRVEYEVGSLRLLVADHGEEGYQLRCLRESVYIFLGDWSRDCCGRLFGVRAVRGAEVECGGLNTSCLAEGSGCGGHYWREAECRR